MRILPFLLALILAPGALVAQRTVQVPPLTPRHQPPERPAPADTLGLRFRLSEATPPAAPAGAGTARAQGTPLSRAEAERVLRRLPPLRAAATAADSFAFPAQSSLPPRTGATVRAPWPPRDSAPRPATPTGGALEVTRRAPEGEVEGAEALGVTVVFSQPMVPLTSVSELAARDVPATLTPQPRGRWRWLDVRTLRFEPEGRMPMATRYTVEVPAGARSATGGVLGAPVRWSFTTPAPRATGAYPHGGPTARQPVLVVAWDQRVDPAAVLPTVRVHAGGEEVPVRLATPEEIAADTLAARIVRALEPGRWTAFRPARPLPGDAGVRVRVGPGTPSAEGPLRTETVQEWSFRTYGPLRVVEHRCGWRGCRPGDSWQIRFNNPLDPQAWSDSLVRVEPAVEDLSVQLWGAGIAISGRTRPQTEYRVRLSGRIRDQFGQTLGADQVVTFSVGSPVARLWSGREETVVLDPAGPPRISIYSSDFSQLRVRVFRVVPEDWPAFVSSRRHDPRRDPRGGETPRIDPPGREVLSRTVTLRGAPGEVAETMVDLSPALVDGLGHGVVLVEPVAGGTEEEERQRVYLWVQSTRIGLHALADHDDLLAWATSLRDGAPLSGVRLTLHSGESAATGADGLATLPLPAGRTERGGPGGLLVARLGSDVALLPEGSGRGGWGGWQRRERGEATAWYVFTDRNLYRPGEEVRFKGWMRDLRPAGEGRPSLPAAEAIRYTVLDPRGSEIHQGTTRLSPLGGFDAAFTLPPGTYLGHAHIRLEREGAAGREHGHGHAFQVQEFRRPEYQVEATADGGPHFVGGSATVTARASYYSGGGLPGTEVRWTVRSAPAHFTPPGWDRWRFGPGVEPRWGRPYSPPVVKTLEGRTDASGAHALRIDFERAVPPGPHTVTAQAAVTDVNRQVWTAQTQLLVHPAEVYVGLRTERAWVARGTPLPLDVVVVDLAGKPVAGREVEVRAVHAGEGEPQLCRVTSAAQPVQCTFRTERGGRYRLVATVRDAAGRASRTETGAWVSGEAVRGPEEGAERQVELVADREAYQPGETAEVLLRAPFFPARGLLSVEHGGIVRTETLRMEGATHVLRLPITERDVPNLQLRVELVGAPRGESEEVRGTDYASGVLTLSVPPRTRTLRVRAAPRDTVLEPGGKTVVEVEVRDAAGRPAAGAEVALVVVDEAVLALTGYRLPDPVATFYRPRHSEVRVVRSRPLVLPAPRDFAPAPRTLVGRVVDAASGTPLGGATVAVEGTGRTATTDSYGRFRLGDVEPGRYTVSVRREGYRGAQRRVEVGTDAPEALRFTLLPQGPEGRQVRGGEVVSLEGAVVTSASDFSGRGVAGGAPPPPPPSAPALLSDRREMAVTARVRGGGGDAPPAPLIAPRTDFDPLAAFVPAARTDAEGRVRVPVELPSSLTRYRVVAVAVEESRFGLSESGITTRKTLMVRPSAPRFLNFGDRFELPVVIQNQTAAPMQVEVAVRASGIEVRDAGLRVTVPANDRVEVRFPAAAGQAGLARFQVAAASGAHTDAAELELPVYTPATTEAFATYGTVDTGAEVLPVRMPAGVLPGFGGLEVTTSSTALQELTDALLYLVRYPFEHPEPMASRVLAVAALRDVLTAFRAEGLPAPEVISASVERDVAALAALQNPDGGWGFWRRGDPSWPFVTVHVAHALQRAKEKGYRIPSGVLERALRYLREVRRHTPSTYPPRVRAAVEAYAVYVRGRAGDATAPLDARALLEQHPTADALTLEAKGWLLHTLAGRPEHRVLADSLRRQIEGRAAETAATATFTTSYGEGEYLVLHSERRTDAVVLEALIAADPRSDLIPKVVRGLLGHRKRGRWESTQENAWVLLALDRYFEVYEKETPEFVAGVWLGERYAGGHRFRGRTTERHHLEVPMRVLAEADSTAIVLGKEGPGRMYYRAGLRYAPADLDLRPAQQGFAVERRYEAVDDPADVRRGSDGVWRVRPGARVRVTVTLTAPARRHHVALVDPLPAGFEPLNPELRGMEEVPEGREPGPARERGWHGRWRWYEHQNLRDDRAEAFASLLPAGTYTYSYVARATTPGIFIVPPPRAEEMYHPETFGRGATERVRVEEPVLERR
jgi:uncharacterized protein YfaS (alpha-2-macroglobulin family)